MRPTTVLIAVLAFAAGVGVALGYMAIDRHVNDTQMAIAGSSPVQRDVTSPRKGIPIEIPIADPASARTELKLEGTQEAGNGDAAPDLVPSSSMPGTALARGAEQVPILGYSEFHREFAIGNLKVPERYRVHAFLSESGTTICEERYCRNQKWTFIQSATSGEQSARLYDLRGKTGCFFVLTVDNQEVVILDAWPGSCA